MSDAQTVKDRLLGQIEAVCSHLLPNGSKKGKEFEVGSLAGEPGKSLKVCLSSGKAGVWKDYATGEVGDIYDLWKAVRNITFKEAFEEASRFVGFTHIERPRQREKPPRPSTDGLLKIPSTPAMDYLQSRGISPETVREYKVFTHQTGNIRPFASPFNTDFLAFSFIDSDGVPVMIKSTGLKPKDDGKKDIWSTPPYATLWGWWLVSSDTRSIIIAEGEIDAMSLRQLEPGIPVLSLPSGVSNLDWIENDFDALIRFDRIYICTDNDALNKDGKRPGEDCAKEIAKRLGLSRCYRIPLPGTFKDANEVLTKGEPEDLEISQWIAAAYCFDPPTLQGVASLRRSAHLKLAKIKEQGEESTFLFPDTKFNFQRGASTLLVGYKGHGKSEFLYQSHIHEMAGGRKVCFASLEIPAEDMLINMATQIVGHTPDGPEFEKALDWLDGKLWFYTALGKMKDYRPMLEDFVYCAKRFGADMFVVDSLHFVVKKDDYEGQDEFCVAYDSFGKTNDVHVLLVAHAKIKKGERFIPNPEDVLGSSGILVPFWNVLSVWRNKAKLEEIEKAEEEGDTEKIEKAKALHDGILNLAFNRLTGYLWKRKLWFNPDSRQFRLTHADEAPSVIDTETQEEIGF